MSPSRISEVSFTSFSNIIDGQPRSSAKFHQGINPATGKPSWDVPIATEKDVDDAVKSANRAFISWSQEPIEKRRELLNKFADSVAQYQEQFTELIMAEVGKPRTPATMEAMFAGHMTRHPCTLDIPEETEEVEDRTIITRYTPLGVVVGICPFNFPLIMTVLKIAPAVMAGNTIIIKPSPFTPYSALKVVELAQSIFPPGVIQAIGGSDQIGAMLVAHPGVHKITFTGSVATGKKVMASSVGTLKRVTLELGGNDPCVVFPDVDIAATAPQLVDSAFSNSGQVCMCTKRIYIHKDIYAPMVKAMAEYAATLSVGEGDDPKIGPLQNKMQYERVKGIFADSKDKGYKLAAGSYDVPDRNGFYLTPTIVDNPPEDSRLVVEEQFGPIIPTQPWEDVEDVIARANSTEFGLGASVWSNDVAQAQKVAGRLQSGTVFINMDPKIHPAAQVTGFKQSGIGYQIGPKALLSFMEAQVFHIGK